MELSSRARRRGSIASVVVLVAAVVVFATRAQGYEVPEPDLHDGAIWVTNEARGLVGRTNSQIATVDTKLSAGSNDFDVLQSGDVVVLHTADPPALVGIDPRQASLVPGPELPPQAQVGLGGSTAALFDPGTGELLVTGAPSSAAVLALDPESEAAPVHVVEGGGSLVVGRDGLVHLHDHETGEITTWDADGRRRATVSVAPGLDGGVLTAVGDRPVLLVDDDVVVPGEDPIPLDLGGSVVVQEPGPAADVVLVSGAEALVAVPLSGGEPEVLHDEGTGGPARPVRVGACVFGAWGATPTYVQLCGDDEPGVGAIPEMEPGVEVRFRVNRDRVTLNSLTDGNQLLFGDDNPIFIDNEWAEALSDEIEVDPEAELEIDEETAPTCESPENGEPIAEPDEDTFGTRRDRPVVVYPLRNDSDPDCDVLLIESVELDDPDAGVLGIIDGGRAVQVDVASDVDRLSFDYTITDGRGGSASSNVVVRVVPDSQNSPPVLGEEETTVVTGGTVTHNVLATAFDPDGDVLRLLRAEEAGTATGTITTNSRGDVTFVAGNAAGPVEVSYVVGDGRGGEQTGTLAVTVVERRENQAPDARHDAVSTFTGREVVVDVLDNDTDPNGDALSIVRAVADESAQVRWEPTSPEIRVRADRPGTVNVVYRVTDGQSTDEAVLRVDVRDRGEKRPPVAVRDEVLLGPGEPAYVPVLDNDVDPDGEVLVVLGVSGLPEPSPIGVTVIRRSVVRIEAPVALTESLELTYRISDGTDEAEGRILVEPASTTTENRPPVVAPDEYTVRAGGIVTFPVLTNDSDPDGDALSVEPPPQDQPDADEVGRLFLSEDGLLRYEAPDVAAGTVRLVYSARDTADNVASAELVVHVLPPNPDRNQPPIAPELVGRTVAGQSVTIPIPITTMDPDGDSVTLLGIDEPPRFGTVVEVGTDELVYLADEGAAGTDELTYRVVDQWGAEATATILVGVARRSAVNHEPIPVDDEAFVRTGATVSIPVLANDFDPDADPLRISDAEEHRPDPEQGSAEIDGSAIRYTAPAEPTSAQTSFRYTVDDGQGGQRSATVTLTFQEQADNRPPIAVDDATEPQVAGAELRLPVLDNDEDPDGDELEIVEVTADGATISPDGTAVVLVMPDEPVQFTYLVSDGNDTARAAVSVPLVDPTVDLPPVGRLDDGIEVGIGESVSIDVLANDEDPEGADVHLLQIVGVRHGSAVIDGDQVVFTASEADYVGDAGFSYVVGDAADPASANTTVASARLRITGDVNTAPTIGERTVELPQGAERTVDLAAAVVDPDPDDEHTFTDLEVSGGGIDADIDGGVLSVRADLDVATGSTASITFTVSDGTDEVEGTVQVRVVGAEEPLAAAGPDAARTLQGEPVTIDVLANDVNPFPGTPLRIVEVSTPSGGAGQATAGAGGITFTPGADFFGETTFTYTVADATDDAARQVSGTVAVTVVGRPSAPPAPTCIGGESGSVRVQWVAPSANGAPITSYVLRVAGGGAGTGDRTVANASTQDVGGLTNGSAYTFQVAAINEAVTGSGSAPNFSPPSPPCTPDEVPGQPAPPVTTFGDRSLSVTWTLPPNAGSPIERLILTNTTSGESREFGPTVTQTVWDGLENGTNVRFTLVAENALGRGPVSPPSTGDGTPAGVPLRPSAPDASPTVGARDGFLDVRWTWSSSQDNGDPVRRFRITSYRNGAQDGQVIVSDPQRRSQTFQTENGVDYQFTVEAENKAGWSEASPRSAVAVSAGRPIGAPSVSASEGDTQTVLTLSGGADDNGAAIIRHEYDVNGNGNWSTLPSNGRITGLSNGTDYRFRVRAVNSEGAGPASAASNTIRPYGSPTTPNVSASRNGREITWTWTASNGNGRAVQRYEYSLDGGAWQNTQSRSFSRTFGYSETHRLRVRAVSNADDPARQVSGIGAAQATTVAAPQPEVSSRYNRNVPCDSNPGSPCSEYSVRGSNLPPNASVSYACRFGSPGNWGAWRTSYSTSTDGSGNLAPVGMCHVGLNNQLQYRVVVGGNTYLTDPVTLR
ncbi:Ig-like domain-containing protein [Actinomarinicola tropica]|uniref:Tandem-95 repeat protein n=1 Tax=Actinomarinicola tropica TaxID=2789776 RepID=A0A5Q2RD45_9ACTN|nr:Ig-like domain-containing protein [Actinomarinicola tropica]QGG93634.1 tandem-95 repeat protein [Actinomarinicola tropica]